MLSLRSIYDCKRNQCGFSLVEVLVAIVIILIAVTALVPLQVHVAQSSQANRARQVAKDLAATQVEIIRAMEFADVGVVSGNPPGDIIGDKVESIDSRNYRVQTFINWVDEGSDCKAGTTNASWDYKLVRVRVTSSNHFMGETDIIEEVETLISREATQPPLLHSSNIRVCVFRGWDEEAPVGNVKVTLTNNSNNDKTDVWSTSGGAALFYDLNQGEYNATVDPSGLGMILKPGTYPKNINVGPGDFRQRFAYVEYPCSIDLTIEYENGELINTSGTIILHEATLDEEIVTTIVVDDPMPIEIRNIWPVGASGTSPGMYTLSAELSGYHEFIMGPTPDYDGYPIMNNGSAWNGQFDEPGQLLPLKLIFIKVPEKPIVQDQNAWFRGSSGNVIQHEEHFTTNADGVIELLPSSFNTAHHSNRVELNTGSPEFNASEMHFENEVLFISSDACLTLRAELLVFRGNILLSDHKNQDPGNIKLFVPDGLGLHGSEIFGGQAGTIYGEVHFVNDVYLVDNQEEQVEKKIKYGKYYFPSGFSIVDDNPDLLLRQSKN